jgi:hypothetical protein
MKNKKLLYGGLIALAVIGIYMWDKNKKKASCSCSSEVKPQGTPTSETYSAMSGYANAGGGRSLIKSSAENAYGAGCAWCKPSGGGKLYHTGTNKTCNAGDRCSTPYSF